ncbi:LapA family protein [Paenibacillus sp. SC116]|uniref:LapA family protein n=1 Tax=Paenibacillus sp. SC116 TaxID=2968986 RepID=UPI00215B1703|nr:LapA family protein [Paenibacillus sp. SC116]MCR8843411.1 LapA family protein [Paenibacillus sp. SC116]
MRIQWTLLAALVFALLTAIFAIVNVEPVQVNLLFGTFDVPLILLILGCTLLGALIVGSYGVYAQYRIRRKVKELEAKVAQLEAESENGYVFPEPTNAQLQEIEDVLADKRDVKDSKNE